MGEDEIRHVPITAVVKMFESDGFVFIFSLFLISFINMLGAPRVALKADRPIRRGHHIVGNQVVMHGICFLSNNNTDSSCLQRERRLCRYTR